MALDKILITTDFSEPSQKVLNAVLEMFPPREGREYHLFHVVPKIFAIGSDVIDKTLYEIAVKEMNATQADLSQPSVRLFTHVRKGEVDTELEYFCKEHPMDLIALSTHGRTGLERWFL